MPRGASETRGNHQATPDVRSDGAIICGHKHGHGKKICRKLIATNDGSLVCPNGHTSPLRQVLDVLLARSNVHFERLQIAMLWPPDESLTYLVKWLAVQYRFAITRSTTWQHDALTCEPWLFAWLIQIAERVHRPSAEILKDFWIRMMRTEEPLVAQSIERMREGLLPGSWRRLMERMLAFYSNFGEPGPKGYLARAEALLEAAEWCKSPLAPLYLHNIAEATKSLDTSAADQAPLFFEQERVDEPRQSYLFRLLLNPFGNKEVALIFTFSWTHEATIRCKAGAALNPEKVLATIERRLFPPKKIQGVSFSMPEPWMIRSTANPKNIQEMLELMKLLQSALNLRLADLTN